MQFQNEQEFKGTYLYKAFLAGIINHLDTLEIDSIKVVGVDYGKDYPINDGRYGICVAHSFYENERFGGTGNYNLTVEKCKNLRYDAYVLGHDHTPYAIHNMKTEDGYDYQVVRPGALTRGTSKTCNLHRKVNVALFDIESKLWEYREIPVKPGLEVFNESVVIAKDYKVDVQDILDNLELAYTNDVYDIMSKNEEQAKEKLKDLYDETISLVTSYFESRGLYNINSGGNILND